MGYTTKFSGSIKLEPKLTLKQAAKWLEYAEKSEHGEGAPDAWLQWVPSDDLGHIVWDGGEKFYEYTEWLTWICAHWLSEWGITANGRLAWQGEETGDTGDLIVANNAVSAYPHKASNEPRRNPLTEAKLARMILESVK